ncbi:MAG: VOC family protein [Bacteroidota bacterium]
MKILARLFFLSTFFLYSFQTSAQSKERPMVTDHGYGNIVWYTLVTPNLDESMSFYKTLLPWSFQEYTIKGQKMAVVYQNGESIGSVVELPKADASLWIGLVSVEDLDLATERFTKNGGKVIVDKFSIGPVGEQIILQGPSSEKLGFFALPSKTISKLDNGEGQWLWTELWSNNVSKSRAFYEEALQLQVKETVYDDKPYWVLEYDGKPKAGLIHNPVPGANEQWVPYINLKDVEGAYQKLLKTKAHIMLAPTEEVRNKSILIFEDPHGATLCIQNYNREK